MEQYSYTCTHPLGHTGPVTGSFYDLIHYKISLVLIFGVLGHGAVFLGKLYPNTSKEKPRKTPKKRQYYIPQDKDTQTLSPLKITTWVTYVYDSSTLTNQNCIAEEIKSRLRSGNACYHSVQYLLSSRLLPKNLKIKIYRNIIFPVVLYGCEAWSLTLREERKLRAFENMVLRRIFGPRRDEVTGEWRRLHNEELNDL